MKNLRQSKEDIADIDVDINMGVIEMSGSFGGCAIDEVVDDILFKYEFHLRDIISRECNGFDPNHDSHKQFTEENCKEVRGLNSYIRLTQTTYDDILNYREPYTVYEDDPEADAFFRPMTTASRIKMCRELAINMCLFVYLHRIQFVAVTDELLAKCLMHRVNVLTLNYKFDDEDDEREESEYYHRDLLEKYHTEKIFEPNIDRLKAKKAALCKLDNNAVVAAVINELEDFRCHVLYIINNAGGQFLPVDDTSKFKLTIDEINADRARHHLIHIRRAYPDSFQYLLGFAYDDLKYRIPDRRDNIPLLMDHKSVGRDVNSELYLGPMNHVGNLNSVYAKRPDTDINRQYVTDIIVELQTQQFYQKDLMDHVAREILLLSQGIKPDLAKFNYDIRNKLMADYPIEITICNHQHQLKATRTHCSKLTLDELIKKMDRIITLIPNMAQPLYVKIFGEVFIKIDQMAEQK